MAARGQEWIDAGLVGDGDATRTWGELSDSERIRIVRFVDHAVTSRGRRKRAKQMLLFLSFGPDSVRGYFDPLRRLPAAPTNIGIT